MPVKTLARPRAKTIEEAIIIMTERMAESDAKRDLVFKELAESQAKTDAKIAESDAKIAESQAKTDLAIKGLAESQAKTDAKIAESDAKIAKSDAKRDLAIDSIIKGLAKSRAETDLAIKEMTQNITNLSKHVQKVTDQISGIGTLNNKLGQLIELIVAPNICEAINGMGHNFKYVTANKLFRGVVNGKRGTITEVDLYLYNGTETMAVEVKTTLTLGWVKEHIDRLTMMREFEGYTKIQHKELYGAVAGVFIKDDAREYALKHGLYVVEIQGDTNKLEVKRPNRRRVW